MNPATIDAIARRREFETAKVGTAAHTALTAAESPYAADFLRRVLYDSRRKVQGLRRLTAMERRLSNLCHLETLRMGLA